MARPFRFSAMLGVLAGMIAAVGAAGQTLPAGFASKGLVGLGRIDHDKKDRYSETFGSLSGLALDLSTWQRSGGSYSATFHAQPDRGYVKAGATTNYRPRRNKLQVTFTPDTNGSSRQTQLDLSLSDTILYTESNGASLTSLDPTTTGTRTGFSMALPQAATNSRPSLDAEGIVLLPDGSFIVSDEYGPYLYRFSAAGVLLGAIRPPEALIPKRSSQDSFSSDSPTGNVTPSQPTTGRENNKGIEGLSLSADGRTLYALMQSATRQDGGSAGTGLNRHARLLAYDVTTPAAPTLTGEWVLPLPFYTDGSNVQQVAEQHELVALSTASGTTKFLVLATDGLGRGADSTRSLYRKVLVYDTASATNIAGTTFDSAATPIAPSGVLATSIAAATSAVLIDLNDSTQLDKFSLNNSANGDSDTLASKWESLVLAPALDSTTPDDFFLFVGNDNDFSTSNGVQDTATYNASPNIDTMVLAYRVTLTGTSYRPIITTQPTSKSTNPGVAVSFTVAASGSPTPTYQWSRNGTAIAGATSATLTLTSPQITDAGSYTVVVTNSAGSVTSSAATLAVTTAPIFTVQPAALTTVAIGSTVVFTATATGSPTPTYQWRKDGLNVGGSGQTLVLTGVTSASAGNYTLIATNSGGTTTSNSAALAVVSTADPGRLTNLSVITDITTSVPNFTVGTVIGPAGVSGTKSLVVRAAGPALGALGVPGTIADPQLSLFNSNSISIAANNDWGGSSALATAMANVGAFAYASTTSLDAAVNPTGLSPGNYSVIVSGVGSATGTAIAEIYDATAAGSFTAASPRLTNVSVLKQIRAAGSLTLGFTIGGATAKTVLIRVIGPGLSAVGVPAASAVSDPQLTLYNSSSTVIATIDDWGGATALTTATTTVGAFTISNNTSKDSMLLLTLPSRSGYTATALNAGTTTGLAIVEVYELP